MTLGSLGVQPTALPYSPTELLNVACDLAQTGSPASDPVQSWNITCGPTQPGSLPYYRAQSSAPYDCGIQKEVMPSRSA